MNTIRSATPVWYNNILLSDLLTKRQTFEIYNCHNDSIIPIFLSNLLRAISQVRVTSVSPLVNWLKVSTINNKTINFKILSDSIVPNLGLFVQLIATLHSSPGERTYLVSFELQIKFFQGQCTDIIEY